MSSNISSMTSREGGKQNDHDSDVGDHTFNAGVALSDDFELDALVSKTLQKISASKFNSKAKACSALHSRLISSGQLSESIIRNALGGIEQRTCNKGLLHPRCALKLHTLIPREGPSSSIFCLLVIHKFIRLMVSLVGNLIEDAQLASSLYKSVSDVAAPLKPVKVVKPETVGRGWFDFQVCQHVSIPQLLYPE